MTTNPPSIDLHPCESSQIAAFGYDEATQVLAIQFPGRGVKPGDVYHYTGVPADVYADMLAAESKGKFFSSSIRGRFAYVKQPDPETGVAFGLTLEQEPKYTTSRTTGRLCNRDTGKPIPDDEPVFVIRAQDIHAVSALRWYRSVVSEPDQIAAVDKRIEAFKAFVSAHPERMKEPDAITLEN